MSSTTTPFGPDFARDIVNVFSNAINKGTKQAAYMLWSILTSFLKEYWLAMMVCLLIVFVVVTFKAMMGRWGSLGSFLYNLFYFGTLFIIGLIWGPEVFVNDFFNVACAVILYPICYFVVRIILEKTGLR